METIEQRDDRLQSEVETARLAHEQPMIDRKLALCEEAGHEFHGNQFGGGGGAHDPGHAAEHASTPEEHKAAAEHHEKEALKILESPAVKGNPMKPMPEAAQAHLDARSAHLDATAQGDKGPHPVVPQDVNASRRAQDASKAAHKADGSPEAKRAGAATANAYANTKSAEDHEATLGPAMSEATHQVAAKSHEFAADAHRQAAQAEHLEAAKTLGGHVAFDRAAYAAHTTKAEAHVKQAEAHDLAASHHHLRSDDKAGTGKGAEARKGREVQGYHKPGQLDHALHG